MDYKITLLYLPASYITFRCCCIIRWDNYVSLPEKGVTAGFGFLRNFTLTELLKFSDMSTDSQKDKKEDKDDTAKYKYHQSQVKDGKEHGKDYPDKPKNNITPEERMINPDRGEK